MSEELTVDAAEKRITDFAQTLIEQLRQQARKPITTVVVEGAEIAIYEGEVFLGPVLNDDGSVHHYSIKLPDVEGNFNWDAAGKSAKERGGHRPTRAEGYLLMARLFGKAKRWFWLDEPNGSDSAWYCGSGGSQSYSSRSAEGGVVAVRRFVPSIL